MYFLSHVVKQSIPNYLSALPIPQTFGGWFSLSIREWIQLAPFFGTVAGITYAAAVGVPILIRRFSQGGKGGDQWVNLNFEKEKNKIVHTEDIEDIGDKKVFCRCWRSKKFPYCDGSHTKHNDETGDNVGPLIVCKKK
ncbi:unnamed protein product [Cyprideis torosa]|uniref:CDGSH iron-sulfur domain-containing protein 2 homologue n=1 Tax=Cyprideis torosa TaxID=163714 RepID=A0A7R8WLD3_9CRUS|nr:unnamed protein product [Cyprideis torosa]CAG0904172.1 unnamed protein product [Cyprideis torosa]